MRSDDHHPLKGNSPLLTGGAIVTEGPSADTTESYCFAPGQLWAARRSLLVVANSEVNSGSPRFGSSIYSRVVSWMHFSVHLPRLVQCEEFAEQIFLS